MLRLNRAILDRDWWLDAHDGGLTAGDRMPQVAPPKLLPHEKAQETDRFHFLTGGSAMSPLRTKPARWEPEFNHFCGFLSKILAPHRMKA